MKLASLDGRFVRARNLHHGVSGRVKPGKEKLKQTYTALLFLLAMHSKAGGRSGVGWGCDELGKERALTKERIGMQSECGLWGFSYEMQRQLWLPSGFSSASLKTTGGHGGGGDIPSLQLPRHSVILSYPAHLKGSPFFSS